jgi:hypothetical protein
MLAGYAQGGKYAELSGYTDSGPQDSATYSESWSVGWFGSHNGSEWGGHLSYTGDVGKYQNFVERFDDRFGNQA